MINNVTLVGRLTKDPEVKETGGGVKVGRFTLAVDRNFKNQSGEKETDFIPVVVWRKTAELVEKYSHKGDLTAVQGRIQVRSYEAQDGTKRSVTEVVADEIQFLSSRKADKPEGLEEFDEIQDLKLPF